jgi:hypothetical protein
MKYHIGQPIREKLRAAQPFRKWCIEAPARRAYGKESGHTHTYATRFRLDQLLPHHTETVHRSSPYGKESCHIGTSATRLRLDRLP